MGKIVTVMNMKGGVGKTTVTANLGGVIANYYIEKRRRVLVVDYDAQFNLSQACIPIETYRKLEKQRKTMLAVLQDDDAVIDPFVLQVPGNHIPPPLASLTHNCYVGPGGSRWDILPSTLDLMYLALGQANTKTTAIEERFARFIKEARDAYDLVLIDCHPAGSLFTKTALVNSDDVLIPVTPQRYAMRGIALMIEFIEAKKAGGIGPKAHVLFNAMPRKSILAMETEVRANKTIGPRCLTSTLKAFKAFGDCDGGANFVWTSSASYSTSAFNNLMTVAKEFIQKTGA